MISTYISVSYPFHLIYTHRPISKGQGPLHRKTKPEMFPFTSYYSGLFSITINIIKLV